jgi:precorrin-6Y C5,15-methyltransferase (decarboxylating)
VLTRLGEPDEAVFEGDLHALAAGTFDPMSIVVVRDPAAPAGGPGLTWGRPESAFVHRDGMITKAEVRAVALAALGPGTGDLVWDVGCGSGSVAVECARLGAAVVAIDSDPGAIELTRRNADAHGVPVRTVLGSAPPALAGLPDPDAAFIGGGGAALPAILAEAATRARRAVVATLALVERIGPAIDRLAAHGLDVSATTIQASRLRPLAGGHRLAAENPVTLIVGRRP